MNKIEKAAKEAIEKYDSNYQRIAILADIRKATGCSLVDASHALRKVLDEFEAVVYNVGICFLNDEGKSTRVKNIDHVIDFQISEDSITIRGLDGKVYYILKKPGYSLEINRIPYKM